MVIRTWAQPIAIEGHGGTAQRRRCSSAPASEDGKLVGAGEAFRIEADMVFTAIGQSRSCRRARRRAASICDGAAASSSTPSGAPASPGVWAGGDCVAGGQDLTVSAVEDGKQAARSIDAALERQAA